MSSANPIDADIEYPDDDGLSMSDSTLQFDWIAILKWNAEAYFAARPDVFVAGDHLIYPERGHPEIRMAPDVYVVFGRPKTHRGSYKLWEEEGIFPQVVIEVWSPSNTEPQMELKRQFYERHGALEYYLFRPEFPATMEGWLRENDRLMPIPQMSGFKSPLLNFTFHVQGGEIVIDGHDGRPLLRPDEIFAERDKSILREESQRRRADTLRRRAEIAEGQKDDAERKAKEAEREKQMAAREAEMAIERAESEKVVKERLAAKLRELGIDPDTV
ncbi:Uma2 family endonuclease [Zavarzinella formosa]|uniref:Uma2 family endonuclease n=1 Tax=Zavarzinella formosa TaxID=360055 RepID=UPI0003092B94|nr:Uma2 family endonuclease [Zavarzinella formosa]